MTQIIKKPKYLCVIDNLSTGGAQRQLVNLAVGMKKRGSAVEVFCYSPGDLLAQPLYEMGIPIYWQIKRSRFSLDIITALQRIIKKGQFDLIISFLSTPNFYTILSGKFLGKRKIPIVVSERFCDLPNKITVLDRLPRFLYPLADHIVFNSHHQRLNFENKYSWLKGHITTIYNGYDLQIFAPASSRSNDQSLKILTIASVSRYKNGLCLVEALNILRQQYDLMPVVTWIGQKVMVGDRLAYLREMEEKIHAYHLEAQWHWLDQRTDIVTQLQQHDVLVHPSYGEGLPNVVCEALACGRPVIVSNTLDHPRLVQDGHSGYLFNWKDPGDLAEKIKIFSDLPTEKRLKMGENGRKYAEQNLSLDRYVDEYEHLFLDILNR